MCIYSCEQALLAIEVSSIVQEDRTNAPLFSIIKRRQGIYMVCAPIWHRNIVLYTLAIAAVGSDKAFLAVSDSVDGWGF